MPLEWQLTGLVLAAERVKKAATRSRSNAQHVCIALAETGNWLYSISEARPTLKPMVEVAAFLYARHQMQHQKAAPVHWGKEELAWVWSRSDSLPPVTRPSTLSVGCVAVKVAVSPVPTLNWRSGILAACADRHALRPSYAHTAEVDWLRHARKEPAVSEPTEREPSPIGDVFLPLFDRCPPQEHRMLLGILERVAAGHYRGWAGLARDEATRRGMLECAKREERIADTLESLEPQAERLVRQVNERFPDLKALYDSVMKGKTLAEQWTIQAIGELGGADVLRNFAEQESDAGKQGVLEGLIPLEEENSAFMRLAATAAG